MSDLLWKDIITDIFPEFVKFFLPKLYKDIDFNKPIVHLEQELNKLLPESEEKNRKVDKLVRVSLKDEKEKLIFIHIEIQSYKDNEFDERIFSYYYRIYDKYKKDIETLAIFTEDNKDYKPNKYEKKFYGTRILFEYNTYKVLEQSEEELLKSKNIFSLVILSVLYSLKAKNEERKLSFKLELARLLFSRDYSEDYLYKLLIFIDMSLKTNEKNNNYFYKEVEKMAIMEGKERALSGYETVVLKQGIQQGRLEGIQERQIEIVKNMYKKGLDIKLISEITNLSESEINKIISE